MAKKQKHNWFWLVHQLHLLEWLLVFAILASLLLGAVCYQWYQWWPPEPQQETLEETEEKPDWRE